MKHNRFTPQRIPDWFLEAVRVMQDANQMLRDIETELRYALRLQGLDPRLRADMLSTQDALGAVKISLSVTDLSARQVLDELAVAGDDDALRAAG